MTFYCIIFGFLFIGACREFFQAAFSKKWRVFCIASTLALLVFNDILFTSHEVEVLCIQYTIWMKLVDLIAFLILTMAFIVLNKKSNFLEITIQSKVFTRRRETIIWSLLGSYWLLALLWNKIGKVYAIKHGYRLEIAVFILILLILMIILSAYPYGIITKLTRWIVPVIILFYILYKAICYY